MDNEIYTFQCKYEKDILSSVEIDGIIYQIGVVTIPDTGKTIIIGFSGQYNALSVVQVLSTLEEAPNNEGEVRTNNDGSHTFRLFKYRTEAGQDFLIIRQPDETALSREEKKWLWKLL